MILNMDIEKLGLDSKIINRLRDNNVLVIGDLWKLKRKELRQMNFSDGEINQIIIKLQLHAIDLNKKIY